MSEALPPPDLAQVRQALQKARGVGIALPKGSQDMGLVLICENALAALDRIEAAGGVEEGWQLVPKEPTEEMLRAMWGSQGIHDRITKLEQDWPYQLASYRAMLSASPSPKDGGAG